MPDSRATLAARDVQLGGLLGAALDANLRGRLSRFIVDEHSAAIELFSPERRARNTEGDWYGEHAGKWLIAAARAAARSAHAGLGARVRCVADYLVSLQEPDGYLGTYAPERRFMRPQLPKPPSWDGAPSVRTWDIWTHSYLILGLLESWRLLGEKRHLDAARRIGDLCIATFGEGGLDITELGNHFGMSATVLMDPAVELYFASGDTRYLELAQRVLAQADAQPQLALLTRALAGADASEIGTGKAYQLAWNLVGIAKLHRATGNPDYRDGVDALWRNIRQHHLSLGGGPWGGVAHRSREVFNPAGVFSPQGYVETCSTLAWIQLNRALFALEGEARYIDEIERAAYNDLLGAQAPDGEDWCYYVFPNGRRVHTTTWRCCKSSGAMALEELPALAYSLAPDGALGVNLLGPGCASFDTQDAGRVTLRQETRYPADGDIVLHVSPQRAARFTVRIRIPSWAQAAQLQVGDEAASTVVAGSYARVEREWRDGDRITLRLPMPVRAHRATMRNLQVSRAPDGSHVEQSVLRYDYVAFSRGPLVYATGLVDGYRVDETLKLPADAASAATLLSSRNDDGAPGLSLASAGRAPLEYQPWYRAGGREDGAWRLTWLSLPPSSDE
jgi:DUF1680 family protein